MSTDSKDTKDIQQVTEEATKQIEETSTVEKSVESNTQEKEVQQLDTSLVNQEKFKESGEKSPEQKLVHKTSDQTEESKQNQDEIKGVELKAQKSQQESGGESGVSNQGDERQRQGSQMQSKIEQNLNTAISAMGGFMSGIINKVQQGAQNSSVNTSLRRFRTEDIIQEREVLMQSAQNRKSSVYALLKDWDTARINALNIHRNILESILGRVDSRMKASQDNISGISTIFRVIVEQVKSAATVSLPNVSATHIYKSVYGKVYEGIHKFENQVQEKKEKALAFAEKVEIDIHQSIIIGEAENYSTTIATIRQNLLNLKRSLHEQQLKVSRKSSKVKDVYSHNIDITKRAKKDFQKSLYSFLQACQDFRDLQVVLAKATVGFWKKAVELEKHRSKVIQRSIAIFNQLHTDYVVHQDIPSFYTPDIQSILSSQIVTDEFIASHMDYNSIISPEDQIYISTQLKKPKKITVPAQHSEDGKQEIAEQGVYDISIQEVYHFLTKISYPLFDDTGLAHKKMNVQREFPKDHVKNTTIVITPDGFLLCYDDIVTNNLQKEEDSSKDQQIAATGEISKPKTLKDIEDEQQQKAFYSRKPDFQMQIQQISIKKNNLTLDIKSQAKSSFMQLLRPSNDIKFIFKSSDQMEEFIQILQALEEITD